MAAINDGIKNQVQGRVAAAANQTIRAGLRKVAGNLLGINTQFDGPQVGDPQSRAIRRKTNYSTELLSYPLDVGENLQQGHYILFNINEYNPAAVEARKKIITEMRKHEDAILAEYLNDHKVLKTPAFGFVVVAGQARGSPRSYEEVRREYIRDHLVDGKKHKTTLKSDLPLTQQAIGGQNARPDSQSFALRYPATKILKTTISLYMPSSVQVSYNMDYSDEKIGFLADIGSSFIQDWREGNSVSMERINEELEKVGSAMRVGLLGLLNSVAPGAGVMAQIQSGRAITPKMELMFNGIGRREFTYEFTFIPKSALEAASIKQIIKQFKLNMSADYIEGSGFREMNLPGTFDITYMYQAGRNTNLNRISTCVLQSADVTYGGDRFQTYAEGVPQQTKLSLKFKEMEIITKSRIAEGY